MVRGINPFGFLVSNRKYPFAHAIRTGFLRKVRDVWFVMNGQADVISDEIQKLNASATDSIEYFSASANLVFKPRGLVDYLTLYSLWAPLFFAVVMAAMFMLVTPMCILLCLGAYAMYNLDKLSFVQKFPGKVLLVAPALVMGVAAIGAVLAVVPTAVVIGAAIIGCELVAAALTVACLPFVALAHGVAWLAGRSIRNKAYALPVATPDGISDNLEACLTQKGLSLDDVCIKGNDVVRKKKPLLCSSAVMMTRLLDEFAASPRHPIRSSNDAVVHDEPICTINTINTQSDVPVLDELSIPRRGLSRV